MSVPADSVVAMALSLKVVEKRLPSLLRREIKGLRFSGARGARGPRGQKGKAGQAGGTGYGFIWSGSWVEGRTYYPQHGNPVHPKQADVVNFSGLAYVCVKTTQQSPHDAPDSWEEMFGGTR